MNLVETFKQTIDLALFLTAGQLSLSISLVLKGMFMRVSFTNFWDGFSPSDFFVPLLSETFDERITVSDEDSSHLNFQSVFPRKTLKHRLLGSQQRSIAPPISARGRRNVWYSAENIRPPLDNYDLTLSFDCDSFGGKNHYLPYALVSMNWWGDRKIVTEEERRAGVSLHFQNAQMSREISASSRPLFACAFIGNPEPIRMEALRRLSAIGQVDVYGKSVGMPVASKCEIAENYRFMLSFENDVYPGYVTEKVAQSWASGCIPLWRGFDVNGIINSRAIVNASNFETMDNWIDFLGKLNQDEEQLARMTCEPIFSRKIDLSGVKAALQNLF